MSGIDPAEAARRKRRHRNERIVASIIVLLGIAAAVVVMDWNRRVANDMRSDRRYIPREVHMTPEVSQLQELVRIDSSTAEGEARAAKWIAAYLERNGVQAELIESAPPLLNVYARIRGREAGEGLLLFNHIDVVPAGSGWKGPAFDAPLFGDRMYGRGTIDMKGLTICQLRAFVDIAKSGRAPAHDLVFLATADEESGSNWGMRWLIEHRPDVLENVRYGITEGGITEMTGEKLTYFGIEIGGKAYVQAIVAAPTQEKLQQARIALEPYIFSRMPDRLLPEVRTYFAQIAPTRIQFRELLTDGDATIRNGEFWRLPPTYRDLAQNSIVTGPVVPPASDAQHEWSMQVTMINLPDVVPDERIAWLAKIVEPSGTRVRDVPVKEGPGVFSSHETPLFRLLADEARRRYDVQAGVQVLYRSASDSRFLRPRGIQAYGVSPYPVTFFQSTSIHNADESITVGSFQEGVEYLRAVVSAWAAH